MAIGRISIGLSWCDRVKQVVIDNDNDYFALERLCKIISRQTKLIIIWLLHFYSFHTANYTFWRTSALLPWKPECGHFVNVYFLICTCIIIIWQLERSLCSTWRGSYLNCCIDLEICITLNNVNILNHIWYVIIIWCIRLLSLWVLWPIVCENVYKYVWLATNKAFNLYYEYLNLCVVALNEKF